MLNLSLVFLNHYRVHKSSNLTSVHLLGPLQLFVTPWTATHQDSLSIIIQTPGLYSNSCPSFLWCHPTISSSIIPYSSCLQSFPASGSFLINQFFPSGGQTIGTSASASVFPMNIQDWSPLGLTGWISLHSKGSQESSPTWQLKTSTLWHSAFFMVQFSHPYMTTGKTIALTTRTFFCKVMSLLFNILSRFVIAFLPRSKCLLI